MRQYLILFMLGWINFKGMCDPPNCNQLLICGNDKVLLVDLKSSQDSLPHIIWQYEASRDYTLPKEYREKYFSKIDECKSVNDGQQVLITSSQGGCALVDFYTKNAVFHAYLNNAHSIELLPFNKVAITASTKPGGDKLALYDLGQNNKILDSDSLYSGHGVVYISEDSSLFVLGYDVLRMYKISALQTERPQLKKIDYWELPGKGGHDLIRIPDTKNLLITDQQSAYKFDTEKYIFSPFKPLAGLPHLKSVNPCDDEIAYTKAEEHWWTHHVRFVKRNYSLFFPDINVYKTRWYD